MRVGVLLGRKGLHATPVRTTACLPSSIGLTRYALPFLRKGRSILNQSHYLCQALSLALVDVFLAQSLILYRN